MLDYSEVFHIFMLWVRYARPTLDVNVAWPAVHLKIRCWHNKRRAKAMQRTTLDSLWHFVTFNCSMSSHFTGPSPPFPCPLRDFIFWDCICHCLKIYDTHLRALCFSIFLCYKSFMCGHPLRPTLDLNVTWPADSIELVKEVTPYSRAIKNCFWYSMIWYPDPQCMSLFLWPEYNIIVRIEFSPLVLMNVSNWHYYTMETTKITSSW